MRATGIVLAHFIAATIMLCGCKQTNSDATSNSQPKVMTTDEFKKLMQTVAEGWNEGNARKAADCYTGDAVYTEPPDKQVYIGRKSLFEFFGGDKQPEPPMKMAWHHLAFDERDQIGFGEYTFQMNNRYHGIAIVKVERGIITTTAKTSVVVARSTTKSLRR